MSALTALRQKNYKTEVNNTNTIQIRKSQRQTVDGYTSAVFNHNFENVFVSLARL